MTLQSRLCWSCDRQTDDWLLVGDNINEEPLILLLLFQGVDKLRPGKWVKQWVGSWTSTILQVLELLVHHIPVVHAWVCFWAGRGKAKFTFARCQVQPAVNCMARVFAFFNDGVHRGWREDHVVRCVGAGGSES